MNLKGIWKSVMLLFFFVNSCEIACSNVSNKEDMELEQQLKILNKPPIKTLLTDEGDTIDCIDIYKQPAFDHPLLKNHKIQLNPTSFPNGLVKTSSEMKNTEIRLMKEACPSGTVPIKRTSKEDLIRTRSLIEQLPGVNDENNINGSPTKIVSVITKYKGTNRYYGGTGIALVSNLSIASDQSSSTNMWIDSGVNDHDINFITTGWKVSQRLYGDGLTRLFTYWAGGKKTRGCYNTLCPGFIVTNNMVGPNIPLTPTSIRGVTWRGLQLIIFQDRSIGHWWLVINFTVAIGYWPKEIFSRLQDGAERVSWGGSTHPGENGIYPPMGNGYKPHSYVDTCYYRQAHYIDEINSTTTPYPRFEEITGQTDPSGCYGLVNDGDWGSKTMGYALMFGGPGGNCGT